MKARKARPFHTSVVSLVGINEPPRDFPNVKLHQSSSPDITFLRKPEGEFKIWGPFRFRLQ